MIISIGSVASNPLNLKPLIPECLVEHTLRDLVFGGKHFFLWDMAFFTQGRIFLTEPFFWNVKFIIHKSMPFVTGIGEKHSGLAVLGFSETAAVLPFHTR